MKRGYSILIFWLAIGPIFSQSYSITLSASPAPEWEAPTWAADNGGPDLSFITTETSFFGIPKKARIYTSGGERFYLLRKGRNFILRNRQQTPRLIRHPHYYITYDGQRLSRQVNPSEGTLEIIAEDGTPLAIGRVGRAGKQQQARIRILQSSAYDEELLAMLSFDLIDYLRQAFVQSYDLLPYSELAGLREH